MDLSSTFITKMKSSLALASVAFSGASAASFEVRGADGNVQMHNTFLKVWSQADLTPSFSSLMDDRSMTHGLPLTHTMKLTNVPLTCAQARSRRGWARASRRCRRAAAWTHRTRRPPAAGSNMSFFRCRCRG